MITDHSEVMSTMPLKVSALNKALNDKDYQQARLICNQIIDNMEDIWQWSIKQEQENG